MRLKRSTLGLHLPRGGLSLRTHDFVHKMAFIKYHVEQGVKAIAPIYTTDHGVQAKTHLLEAIALLDSIDHKLVSMALEVDK